MSEYWKSQPKKFCDFCKCWITDNKPSVDFHEKGKRHQENVKLRIEEVKKKGSAAEKQKNEENGYLQQMEKDAIEAFKKDLQDNPELAKKYNVRLPEEEPVYEGPQLPASGVLLQPEPEPKVLEPSKRRHKAPKLPEPKAREGQWYEAMSESGYPYFWNTVTEESLWVAPEKYVSLADQGLAPPTVIDDSKSTDPEDIPLPPGIEDIPLPGQNRPASPPSPQPSSSSSSSSEEEEEEDEEVRQDRHGRGVFGTWQRVQNEAQAPIDLELPIQPEATQYQAVPVITEEPVRLKIKEKQVTLKQTGKGGPVAFKKRKLGSGSRNVRHRGDDD